jgi:nucleoside-diphosphate-sugar epimerase
MHVILGAGGDIGQPLVRELLSSGNRVRLVSRNPKKNQDAAESIRADLTDTDQTVKAVSGATVVYLLAGLKYDLKVWRDLWPLIMRNTIEACKRAKAKLIFFDNVYMYGRVDGLMTEETPFHPISKKGEIRVRIATMLLDEIKGGNLTALIARSADFYGPDASNSIANILVFDKLGKGDRAMWLINDSVKHSFTFIPDAAKSLILLAGSDVAWNQTWHVPTAPNPPTGKEFITMVAHEFGVEPKYRVLKRPLLKIIGLFDSNIKESYEMLYQSDSDYLFDSTKFTKAFHSEATSYPEGIRITAVEYKKKLESK